MIKAVLFDLGQTLIDSSEGFRQAEKKAQKKIFSDLGITQWEEFLYNYRRIRTQFHESAAFSRMAIWQEVYWYYCRHVDSKKLQTWQDEYWITVKEKTYLFPETEQTLNALTSDYKLALITNTQGPEMIQRHRLNHFPQLEKYFEVVIIAGENNIPPKPDPAVFKLCLDKLNVRPSHAVFVGDDWLIDIIGAEKVRLHPIWLQHHLVHRKWPRPETTVPIIKSLDEVPEQINAKERSLS